MYMTKAYINTKTIFNSVFSKKLNYIKMILKNATLSFTINHYHHQTHDWVSV